MGKVIPGNEHLKEFRDIAREYLKNKEYSNVEVVQYFEKQYSIVHRKKVTATYAMSFDEIKVFADMTPLLFHVYKARIDLTRVKELTIDAEVLVGTL